MKLSLISGRGLRKINLLLDSNNQFISLKESKF
jgi:hypothetical protein